MNSPTITSPAMTQAGMILGTAAYMSPEQARGKVVDKRTDVWAFGAVLYEMLAGVRPFAGEDATEMIAAVVKSTPDWSALPADVPRPLVTLIQRCLEKDRKARVGDIAVARFLLADAATLGASMPGVVSPAAVPRSAVAGALAWAVAGALGVGLLAALGLWAPWRVETPVERPLVRLDVDLGADVSLPAPGQAGSSVVISPDGTRLVYASGTPPRLYMRRLDQPNAVELPGTQGATAPFFSPDGQWVGFSASRQISKIAVDGGAVVPLGDVATFRGASWDGDGSVIVASGVELRRVGTSGTPSALATPGDGELGLFGPQSLPGGTAVLFSVDNQGDVNQSTIQVLTLADGQRKTVIRGGASGRYLATANGAGHLVYLNQSTLFAVPFDVTTLEVRGDAVPILNDVASEDLAGLGQFDVSGTGTLVYRRDTGRGSALNTLQWVDAKGGRESLRAAPTAYLGPRVSPDGTRVALFTVGRQGTNVAIYDPQRDVTTRLTSTNQDNWPVWSPDGRHVVFRRNGVGLLQARADGARPPQVLVPANAGLASGSFAPDGRRLAYTSLSMATRTQQIWTVPIEDRGGELYAGTPERFLESQFVNTQPAFSPDGRWLAYVSNESGTEEVYVRPFPPPASGQGSRWQISNTGGTAPLWSRNGRELMYQAGDQIMAVSYAASGDAFAANRPQVWIAALGAATTRTTNSSMWDLAPDGTRVLAVTPAAAEPTKAEHHVVFLQNFFDELRRKVPLGK
jgi:Tol biopolymer transport system component